MKRSRNLFELQTDFFKPLWIRIAVVAVCFAWAIFEYFAGGGAAWSVLFAGIGSVAFHQFFLDGWPNSDNSNPTE